MKFSYSSEKRLKSNILFLLGIGLILFFAWAKDKTLSSYWIIVISACLFGPGVLLLGEIKNGRKKNGDSDDNGTT